MVPSDIKLLNLTLREIKFEFEQTEITFYKHQTNCLLEDEKINTINYTLENLKLIKEKLSFVKPILFKIESNKKNNLK